ncbi:SET and MYND domain-containing protein 4-like isoform X1 [Zingiber officinale]|uniref:SET and MYND domain-containing protein 4-like isoform X1 n=1 Tax=Zingiber officinale TaxID=94328 RepID=UPI001C4D2A1F|nr:SET and MYND domain-containing protein 4-like isoform X1 [Zingiber officinale]
MERLKSLIPDDLKRMIGESTPENLTISSSLILDFLRSSPQFQQVIRELTDPELALCRKNKEAALDSKQKGNECFTQGQYAKALTFYSQALRHAPASSSEMDASLVATLYVNRASAMHNLGLLKECVRDCNRAIAIFPTYVKAWYRRGKANASLKNYEHAKHDLEVAASLEENLFRKNQIKGELGIVLKESDKSNVTAMANNGGKNENVDSSAQLQSLSLQCVSTPDKGRGLTFGNDIPPASLVHHEQPLAAILLKAYRETRCHFCFEGVPTDLLFCPSCTIPVYCSNCCLEQAVGEESSSKADNHSPKKNVYVDLEKSMDRFSSNARSIGVNMPNNHIPEHHHECGGLHWSAVLPPDIVLAARIIAISVEKWKAFGRNSSPLDYLDFVHHYAQNSIITKLESHVYAVVLLHCLHHFYNSDFPFSAASVAQLVLVISQVKVNSMAVVHMRSLCGDEALGKFTNASTSKNYITQSTEQVRVAQAIYTKGSLFNHSCQPNSHAYFISRTLFVHSIELVPAWSPLELSYGPQVGQLDLQDRQKLLEEQYSFQCQCFSCSTVSLSDLVINAFRCIQPHCLGVVLEAAYDKLLEDKSLQVSNGLCNFKISLHLPSHEKEVYSVARMLLRERGAKSHFAVGRCLSCGSYRNLKDLSAASKSYAAKIQRLKDSLDSDEVPDSFVPDMLNSLVQLRSVRHPYSKIVAEAEDNVAEAFVRIGEFKLAEEHCIASIKILEKLYPANHVVMGHELMKLASVQLCSDDYSGASSSVEQVESILSLHYGCHLDRMFPHLKLLKREAERSAS